MFFRGLCTIGLVLLTGLVGCTARIGEEPPAPKNIELSATKCLNKSANDLRDFFDGSVQDQDQQRAWLCVESAFLQFEKYVVGREKDRYTSQEIVTFLESNFFENSEQNKIGPELQKELMKLKQMFVGGTAEHITREELKRSQPFLQQISRMTLRLNKHMPIIVLKWKADLDQVKATDLKAFEDANRALQEFAVELAGIVAKNNSNYRIDNFVILFKEFEKFFNARWDWILDLENFLPGVKKLKKALAGGDENTVNQKEWDPVLTLGARGYFQFLRYYYFIKTTPETGGSIRLVYVARTLEDVFSIFQDLVSRKETGAVTTKEVHEILNGFQQVWTDLKVSEKLIKEFMKIKQVMIGGSVDNWTAVDFEQARLKVPELRRIIENFMPYFSIYASEWDPQFQSPQDARVTFGQAQSALVVVAQDFGRFLQGPYSYDDLTELLAEIDRLYPQGGPRNQDDSNANRRSEKAPGTKPISETIKDYREVFLELKKMVYNQPDTIIQKDQWDEVLPLAARIFSMFQYYDYFLQDKEWKQSQAISDIGQMVDNGMVFARNLLQISYKGFFDQDELVSLTQRFTETDLFSQKLKLETTQKMWTAILQHFLFDPARRLRGEKNDRLTLEQFQILQREFEIWKRTQLELNDIFEDKTEVSLSPAQLIRIINERITKAQNDPELREGLEGIKGLLDNPVTSTFDAEDQLQVSNRNAWEYRLNSLLQNNITRALTRLLMRSFAADPNLQKVDKCETQNAFNLLRGVFRDLKIFDPADSFIDSRFLEANIFTSRGNGDKILDYFELSDLINIVSSGLRVNTKLEKSLRNICPVQKTSDGKEFVTFKCLSEHHYVMTRRFMTQLPDFKAYVDRLSKRDKGESAIMRDGEDLTLEQPPAEDSFGTPSQSEEDSTGETQAPAPSLPQDGEGQTPPQQSQRPQQPPRQGSRSGFATWNSSFRQLMKATSWQPNKGYGGSKEESVYIDESLYFPFVVYYMEMIYTRYDSTKNGFIQSFEAKRAFRTFRPLLKDLAQEQIDSGLINESDLLSVFTFILRYKEEPSLSSLFRWLAWKGNESKWEKEVYVGRTDFAQILGFIADRARQSNDTGPAPICKPRVFR